MAQKVAYTVLGSEVKTQAYTVSGPDCQVLTVALRPGDAIVAEIGTMMFTSKGTSSSASYDCSRCCTGESMCKIMYTNGAPGDGVVALTPNLPAKIIPIELSQTGTFISRRGAFIASLGDVKLSVDCNCCNFAGWCGGMGAVKVVYSGNGTLFLSAAGTVVQRNLQAGETMIVDNFSLVGYQDTVTYGARLAQNCCCGGEGLVVSTVTGPGLVIIQSVSWPR